MDQGQKVEHGQPLTFNIEGNITEGQHRLHAIVAEDVTVPMIVVLGVQLDCFTNVAPAKIKSNIALKMRFSVRTSQRRSWCEVSTLRQLLKRRQGAQLSMKNAITQWEFWRKDIREGLDLVDGFFDEVSQFDPWKSHIFCISLLQRRMISIGEREGAENFLDMLADQILRDPPSLDSNKGTVGFQDFLLDKFFVYGSNAGRTDIIFMLLCVAADRVLKKPNGEIELNITPDKLNHTNLKNSGVYRKFLENCG